MCVFNAVYINSLIATLCARNKFRNLGLNTTAYFVTEFMHSDAVAEPRMPSDIRFAIPRATVVSVDFAGGASNPQDSRGELEEGVNADSESSKSKPATSVHD